MTKISKLILGAGALGVMGIAALPIASHAAAGDVLLQLTVSASSTGDCAEASITSGSGSTACEGTGGNNGLGYTWTIVDKDGSKFNMALGDATGGAAGSGGLAPISGSAATVTGTNVYGVKFGVTTATNSGYTGNLNGSVADGLSGSTNVSTDPLSSLYLPVKTAPVASIKTNGAGMINITTTLGVSTDSTLAAGVYENTLKIQTAVANTP